MESNCFQSDIVSDESLPYSAFCLFIGQCFPIRLLYNLIDDNKSNLACLRTSIDFVASRFCASLSNPKFLFSYFPIRNLAERSKVGIEAIDAVYYAQITISTVLF